MNSREEVVALRRRLSRVVVASVDLIALQRGLMVLMLVGVASLEVVERGSFIVDDLSLCLKFYLSLKVGHSALNW